MATKRVLQSSVDWSALAKRYPKGQMQDFLAFKAKSDGYLRKAMANPEEPPKIDWSYYKANIANKALVDQFEKAYSALKLPYPEDKGSYEKIEEDKKRMAEDIAVFMKNSNARIKKYQEELDKFEKVLPIEEMSCEEFGHYYPHIGVNHLENPMLWPEVPSCQESKDEIAFWKARGVYYPNIDKYYPDIEKEVKEWEESEKTGCYKLPANH